MRKRKYSSLIHPDCSAYKDGGTPLPTVHNIVATSQIGCSVAVLDLNKIHEMLPFSFYDQHKFAAITVRLHKPDCTTLLFSSGKLVVTGCRSWYECVYASLFITSLLRECIPGHSFFLQACDVRAAARTCARRKVKDVKEVACQQRAHIVTIRSHTLAYVRIREDTGGGGGLPVRSDRTSRAAYSKKKKSRNQEGKKEVCL